MSKKANPTLIGGFVLLALAAAVVAVMALGKFRFRDDSLPCVAFFSGSLRGLDVGAPVAFRGVNIGRVRAIHLDYDDQSGSLAIPVIMEIQEHFAPRRGKRYDRDEMRATMEQLIGRGLRARMQASSLLTGKQYVELSLKPDSEPVLRGAPPGLLEIPTLASELDKITETLERLPLEDILPKLALSLDTLNQAINSEKTAETVRHLAAAAERLESILRGFDDKLPQLLAHVERGVDDFSGTMGEAKNLIAEAKKELKPAGTDLHKTLAGVQGSIKTLEKTLANLERLTASDSDLGYQLRDTVREMERAASSIRELTDYLRQNPNSLLFGQGKERKR